MIEQVYLALYKGKKTGRKPTALLARLNDWLIRKLTKGIYSHCEIVIKRRELIGNYDYDVVYDCYSSSPRDGGVRMKQFTPSPDKWDLIELNGVSVKHIDDLYQCTKGKQYDWLGALGVVFKNCQNPQKYFCSEWVATALGLNEPWRFSPNDLGAVAKLLAERRYEQSTIKSSYTFQAPAKVKSERAEM